MYQLSDYTFHLPKHKIAHTARHPAHDGLLMIVDKKTGQKITDTTFWNLDTWITKNHTLFFNNSKVVPARVYLQNTKYISPIGEQKILDNGELFFLKKTSQTTFDALVRPGKKFKIGTRFFVGDSTLEIVGTTKTGRNIEIHGEDIDTFLETYGSLPLPPYIKYSPEKEKDYQSIFATKNGSVAAPTASLHFTDALLAKLPCKTKHITLHVGLGTFASVDTNDIRDYQIHSETVNIGSAIFEYIFEEKNANHPILAVGTTVCRTLESLPALWKHISKNQKSKLTKNVQKYWDVLSQKADENWIHSVVEQEDEIIFSTQAYIVPGYDWLVVDEVISNFHLPESSLLMLVASLIGRENLLARYHDAIAGEYQFYSFGDAMYIR